MMIEKRITRDSDSKGENGSPSSIIKTDNLKRPYCYVVVGGGSNNESTVAFVMDENRQGVAARRSIRHGERHTLGISE